MSSSSFSSTSSSSFPSYKDKHTSATRNILQIKTRMTARLSKELWASQKDAEIRQERLDKVIGIGADELEVVDATQMNEASLKAIVDASNRLGKAVIELRKLVVSGRQDAELAEYEELMRAEEALEVASI